MEFRRRCTLIPSAAFHSTRRLSWKSANRRKRNREEVDASLRGGLEKKRGSRGEAFRKKSGSSERKVVTASEASPPSVSSRAELLPYQAAINIHMRVYIRSMIPVLATPKTTRTK